MKCRYLLAFFAGLAAIFGQANDTQAGIIFENPRVLTNGDSLFRGDHFGAEDFTLTVTETLAAIEFTTTSTDENKYRTAFGTVDWRLYDGGSLPGLLLASGDGLPTTVVQGPGPLIEDRVFTVDIPDIQLGPGDYWFAIHFTGSREFWAEASGNGRSALSTDGGVSWSSPYSSAFDNAAFRLHNTNPTNPPDANVIPEPSTFAIWSVLGAAVGFGAWRRRRKR